ncbi:DUF1707 SHOCT-like domain-containing protein [Pseudonocardia lacus]|uniref:DUF1707 SHOCT-like domain-containing protein n=1 Tax=Pseudonocardia lacus TaxID=2835865 RepID=UPI001BDBCD70|nr:DUF1707 domain-containing protein [Pseudonocardia lacus]
MNEPVRPEDMRISDADRERVQDQLKRAHDAGQLDLHEFDERAKAVWESRTRGQLARVTADLPNLPAPRAAGERRPVFSDTGGGIAMRVLTIVFASLALVNLTIWGIISVTTGLFIHPWWLYVALPPAVVLGVLYAAGIGRPPRER